MAENMAYDLCVIGSGPGGEVAAIRAAQLGFKVALVEKRPYLGGTCLNVGCIPTKALLQAATTYQKLGHLEEQGFSAKDITIHWDKVMARKDHIVEQQRKGLKFLMKKNKIDVYQGHGRFKSKTEITVTDDQGKVITISTKNTLIATGSRVREFSFARSNDQNIMTSDTILFIKEIPSSLAVIGGGVVGTEFASLFSRLGTQVTIVELADQILPSEDHETVKELEKFLKKTKVEILTQTKLVKLEEKGTHVEVHLEGKEPRKFEKVLVSIGREPVTDDLGLENIGLPKEEGGYIKTDEHYRTMIPHVWAIGDVIKTPALAHTASAEGIHAVEDMAGHHPPLINYDANPNAIYTYPEIASIGKTEKQLKSENIEYQVAKFPFAPMAKAKIEGATEGFVKLLYEPKYKELLGVHIVHAKATEFIAEFALGKNLETTVDEIAFTIHPHPTLSETLMEAAHAAMDGPIHM